MLFWIAIAAMTGVAVMAVLWPLSRQRARLAEGVADLAVYRDQLAEIERDRASRRLPEAEAEAARIEVARRMIGAADRESAAGGAGAPDHAQSRRRLVAVLALALVPLLALGTYFSIGSPGMDGRPLAERLAEKPEQTEIDVLLARVESHLESNPNDGRGFEVVAPIYMRLGRVEDAQRAWSSAIRLLGATADREAGLGEAITAAAGGVVTDDASEAFERAARLDKANVKAAYYLGLAAEQDGNKDEAAAHWRPLVESAPPDAPWLPAVRAGLARVEAPGPDAAAVKAAETMTPDERAAMIRGMVEGLSSRLAENGHDLDGWLRLIRAWSVLGDTDKAKAAVGDARRSFANEAEPAGRIDALARELGLEG